MAEGENTLLLSAHGHTQRQRPGPLGEQESALQIPCTALIPAKEAALCMGHWQAAPERLGKGLTHPVLWVTMHSPLPRGPSGGQADCIMAKPRAPGTQDRELELGTVGLDTNVLTLWAILRVHPCISPQPPCLQPSDLAPCRSLTAWPSPGPAYV